MSTILTTILTVTSGTALLLSGTQTVQQPSPAVMVERSARAQASVLRPERGPDGRLYVTASIDGHPVRFMVDTGANRTVLAPRDAAALGIVVEGRTQLNTVGTTVVAGYGTAHALEIGSSRWADRRILIVPGLECSLLGMDLLGELEETSLAI